ncbi:hypothetical protein BgiMline_005756 [Biomphalaria glabrata]|uniref:Uncharacterized protein LOC106050262 n=1 Tax=Biomphalaria glabrata TaxID=6526 RepID=A0A2C9KWS2_BIOGL|nr:uncharacterized protein LOC106050262 [Biomphalaria glabrata]KAI8766090.1 hypothetical protein BgiMline_003760 [Biomphalaria glabrata]KAI8793886.1 hypothetical protein BgiBS90_004262 [Biomphalaria glabrata]
MSDSKTALLSGSRPTAPPPVANSSEVTDEAVYHDSAQSPTSRFLQILFVGLVVVMVLVSISLSIYRGSDVKENGGMYFMLAISLVGFALVEIIMIIFTRRGDLPKGKTWFLYFVGFCIMLESIFTDVLVFD